jgi:hypothetical protein
MNFAQTKAATIAGWVLTGLLGAAFIASAVAKFAMDPNDPKTTEMLHGFLPSTMYSIAVVELACVILYLYPRTAVLGAILLTGYLGGAIATHVRIQDGFAPPLIMGVLVWLGLYLRSPRLRELIPYCLGN